MSGFTHFIEVLTIASLLWGIFGVWGIFHERVASHQYHHANGEVAKNKYFFMICILAILSWMGVSILALLVRRYILGTPVVWVATEPRRWFVVGGIGNYISLFNYGAAKLLPYPMYLSLKMSKMIPFAIVGRLFYRQTHSLLKWAAVALITGGVIIFRYHHATTKAKKAAPTSSSSASDSLDDSYKTIFGVFSVCMGVLCESFYNNIQDELVSQSKPIDEKTGKAKKGAPPAPMDSIQAIYQFSLGGIQYAVLHLAFFETFFAVTGVKQLDLYAFQLHPEVVPCIQLWMEIPQMFVDSMITGALNGIGGIVIFIAIARLGTLSLTGVLTLRKVLSVGLSVWVNDHSINMEQQFGLVAVVIGVVLDTIDGAMGKQHKKKKEEKKSD